jgi:hypothetical protein
MSRAINLSMSESSVIERCRSAGVGVSALETLPGGGVRLVCMSSDGAEIIRQLLKSKLLADDKARRMFKPTTPLW